MSQSIRVDIDGAVRKLRAAGVDVDRSLDAAMRAGALEVENLAKSYAPVLTGTLRRSITTRKAGKATYEVGPGGPATPYAAHVEFGTSRMGAQPYMLPAAMLGGRLVPAKVQAAVRTIVARHG